MATFSIDDLTTPLTRAQVETKIYEVLAIVGTDTTSWKPGSVARAIITGCAILFAAFSTLTAQIARSGFLELAEGKWLALVAWYVYGVRKEYAVQAEGELTLINAGGGVYELDADDLVVANPTTGKQYRNSTPISLTALSTGTVAIRAVEAGAASTSAPGTITELVTPLLGVTCGNGAAVVGLDEETDPVLRARCREKLGALSPFGPWDAYSSAVRGAKRTDGSRIGVTRVRTVKDGYGGLTVYVATASGAVTGTVGDVESDLGAVDEAIQQWAAPLTVTANTASTTPVSVPVTYRVWMYNTSGLTQAAIAETIRVRLIDFMTAQPIGGNLIGNDPGKLFVDALRTAIGSALPEIFHVEVTAPAADVVLTIGQVPVLGAVTPTSIVQVPPSEGSA
jgi:phage-related baseplate assembly protein